MPPDTARAPRRGWRCAVAWRARVGEGFIQPAFDIGFGDTKLAEAGRNADVGAQVANRLNR